jgi:hypothetical protein
MGLRAKILTHTRCHLHDVQCAVETGVDGINLYMATSAVLSQHSHGKGIDAVIEQVGSLRDPTKPNAHLHATHWTHCTRVCFSCHHLSQRQYCNLGLCGCRLVNGSGNTLQHAGKGVP